jgi:hypothetical protein
MRLLVGFLLGVGTTLIVVYWLDAVPTTTRGNASTRPQSTENTAGVSQADLPDSPVNEPETGGTAPGSRTVNVRPNQGLPDASDSLPENTSSAAQSQPTGSPRAGNRASTPGGTSPASESRDDYPPEIADMIANNVDKDLQARYETDDREESWATYMEGQLAAYFSQKPELAQFYISLIDCRTSVCSVHALGYGPDALTIWNSATADLVSQPWFEFNAMSMNRRNPQPDVLGIVLIVTKQPPA